VTIGEPVYAKVPIPGMLLSGDPASVGTTRMKAKARIKLRVGI
jgi:hypothetical protein